jgi:2-polyprenyl-6-hydroxyphenyl methylase/3-demethylubiquinone-9 3-methyltransferase
MSTVDAKEISKFTEIAEKWWNESGPFAPLHRFNPVRIEYLRDKICTHFSRDVTNPQPLKALRIIDVGAGGGLLSEPLARMGAEVLGIDAGEANIAAAKIHAENSGVNVEYLATTAEEIAAKGQVFDVVLAMEIIEHVADINLFLQTLCKIVAPGGILCVATINRTAQSFLKAIIGAEYVLRWLPRGTHEWKRFCKPSEIAKELVSQGLEVNAIDGVSYSIITRSFAISRDVSVNYMLLASRG